MTRVSPQPFIREPVELVPRRSMTLTEKVARWESVGCVCTICGEPCEPSGPTVVWDHRIALALGGTNDLENMEPHHAVPCAAKKTAADLTAIAKAKRLEAKQKPRDQWPRAASIPSRPFQRRQWGEG